jgi:hypothetical protein
MRRSSAIPPVIVPSKRRERTGFSRSSKSHELHLAELPASL